MAQFKPLHGDESRISLEITPFKEGSFYMSHNGNMYVDLNLGTAESPNYQRIKLNAEAVTYVAQTLTEEQKAQVRANIGVVNSGTSVADAFGRHNRSLSWNEDETVCTETWVQDGKNYKQVITEVSDNEHTIQLTIDGVNAGLWTTTIDERNGTANTVYTAQ